MDVVVGQEHNIIHFEGGRISRAYCTGTASLKAFFLTASYKKEVCRRADVFEVKGEPRNETSSMKQTICTYGQTIRSRFALQLLTREKQAKKNVQYR